MKYRCHVISNTHWDREWRYPFQVYRMELVGMMDGLLDILEQKPDYRAFFLDSQTVILEDYLEIRPENRTRITAQVRAGRLQIGPWYTLPDQWGCPGEALVRNLLMGHRVAKAFGPVSKVGYTPFSNGQISQLPQIYRGFGIDSCFFYRGIGKHVAPSDFIWEGPDGSRLFAFRFGDFARYNYYYLVYRPGLLGRFNSDRVYVWNPDEIPFHVATETSHDRQYGWLSQTLHVHEENLPRALSEARENSAKDTATPEILYMMGHDHSFAAAEEVDLIRAAQKSANPSDEDIFHSALDDYMNAWRAQANTEDLKVLKGEMRHTNKEGLWTNLMAQILSTRLYLKQENASVNSMILHGSEPLAAMALLAGSPYPRPFFEIAWKKILINQAHDAVGGCSVDPVHQEMQARWSEVRAISEEICRNSMKKVARRIDGSSIQPQNLQLTLFNPLPFPRDEVARVIIDIPSENPRARFTVETPEGRPVPLQVISRQSADPTIEGGYELSMPFKVQRFVTDIQMENLPAMGHQALVVKPAGKPAIWKEDIVRSRTEMENEFLRVRVNLNGTVAIEDKISGRIMENLCLLEDCAEFGDPWNHVVPDGDRPLTSASARARISVHTRGPLTGALKASFVLRLPAGRDAKKGTRSSRRVPMPVTITCTLRKNSPVLDILCDLENNARDHRLRMIFPSHLPAAQHSVAGGQYDVLKRPIAIPDSTGWKEGPYPTHPFWDFVDVSDGRHGLGIISDGLIEYEVKDEPDRPIVMTLIRAFGKFVFDRPTPGAQCLGKHAYHFFVYPHTGTWAQADIYRQVARLKAPLHALLSAPTKGDLPLSSSLIKVSPDSLVFSGVKESEDGRSLILRFWNPSSRPCVAEVKCGFPLAFACRVTLEELPMNDLPVLEGNTVRLEAGPAAIVTLSLTPGGYKVCP